MKVIETTSIQSPVTVGSCTLFSVEKNKLMYDSAMVDGWCYCSKQLVAVVVQTPFGVKVFDPSGVIRTVNDLKRVAPEIENRLDGAAERLKPPMRD